MPEWTQLLDNSEHNSTGPFEVRVSPKAKRVRITVTIGGRVTVVVPNGFDHWQIPSLLDRHARWLQRAKIRMQDRVTISGVLPQRVDKIELASVSESWAVHYRLGEGTMVEIHSNGSNALTVNGPVEDFAKVQSALRAWVKQHIESFLIRRVDELSRQAGCHPAKVTIRSQKTRWGSCSSSGAISLNLRLAFLPAHLVDYVILHEIAHLSHMDHSIHFWDTMETLVPQPRRLDRQLRASGDFVPYWIGYTNTTP